MYEAEEESMNHNVIKSSFKNTGIYPFDPEKIRNLAYVNCGKLKVSKVDMVNDRSQCLSDLIHDISNNSNAENISKQISSIEFLKSPQKLVEQKEKFESKQEREGSNSKWKEKEERREGNEKDWKKNEE